MPWRSSSTSRSASTVLPGPFVRENVIVPLSKSSESVQPISLWFMNAFVSGYVAENTGSTLSNRRFVPPLTSPASSVFNALSLPETVIIAVPLISAI